MSTVDQSKEQIRSATEATSHPRRRGPSLPWQSRPRQCRPRPRPTAITTIVETDARSTVIGDTPYGDAQIAAFPRRIGELNAELDVRMVVHVDDIQERVVAAHR